ncbi:NAD(P)-binding protein [Amylocystis lapponica]|nr:NAD(P)-binding protein [Amylocystis lapponica]
MAPKIWFITGSSSGFGRAMTELVLKNGDIAVATLRKPSALTSLTAKYPASQLLVVQLDITQPGAIVDAFAIAQKAFGRIDVVFNNAGSNVISEVESASDADVRKLFEVNFWGAANVSKEAVRFFRDVNKPAGGYLLQIGSSTAINGNPVMAHYSGTKAAVTAFTEGLAAEIAPEWNIKITVADVGGFHTEIVGNSAIAVPHPAYDGPDSIATKVRQFVKSHAQLPVGDPQKGVQVLYKLANLADPPLRFPLGKDSVEAIKQKSASLLAVVQQYESWSEGLVG